MKSWYCLLVLSLLLLISCGPPKPAPESTTSGRYAYDLEVEVNDRMMTLAWKVGGDGLLVGYNIYVSEVPLADEYSGTKLPVSVEPFNHAPFAGDTEPEDGIEYFEAEGLENGKQYYVSVCVVNADRTLSKPSNEIQVSCGPRGEMTLQIRFQGDQDGFSFQTNRHVRADGVENDLYFYSKDGVDYLASPSRLDGFLRETMLMPLDATGDIAAAEREIMTHSLLPNQDRIAVEEGHWVWISTPERGTALVKVLGFTGQGSDRVVKLYYAFDPRGRWPHF